MQGQRKAIYLPPDSNADRGVHQTAPKRAVAAARRASGAEQSMEEGRREEKRPEGDREKQQRTILHWSRPYRPGGRRQEKQRRAQRQQCAPPPRRTPLHLLALSAPLRSLPAQQLRLCSTELGWGREWELGSGSVSGHRGEWKRKDTREHCAGLCRAGAASSSRLGWRQLCLRLCTRPLSPTFYGVTEVRATILAR